MNDKTIPLFSDAPKYALLITLLFITLSLASQSVTLPYYNGWEDDAENQQWVMNEGTLGGNLPNQWFVSSKDAFCGARSAVISTLGTADTLPVYTSDAAQYSVLARRMTLPLGDYNLSFAWRSLGELEKGWNDVLTFHDGMYVVWMPDDGNSKLLDSKWGKAPADWTTKNAEPFGLRYFNDSLNWNVTQAEIHSDGQPGVLAFVWVNDANGKAGRHSVSVDDIQIAPEACGDVTNITHTTDGDRVQLKWSGVPAAAATYEVMYNRRGETATQTVTSAQPSLLVTGLTDGVYDFYVRAVCSVGGNPDTTLWFYHGNVVVNGSACIDYTNLYAPYVVCRTGETLDNPGIVDEKNDKVMVVDYGEYSIHSQHTLCTRPGEKDPIVDKGLLYTMPPDEPAAIRVGNQSEFDGVRSSVSYEMELVPGDDMILLIKNAIVLHRDNGLEEPELMGVFRVEITDERGKPLNDGCGVIEVRSSDIFDSKGNAKEGWKLGNDDTPSKAVWYRDWSTIALDMKPYVIGNKPTKVRVRLVTADNWGHSHFCYAYYAISCISGTETVDVCEGDDEILLQAPSGFSYRWYTKDAAGTETDLGFTTREIDVKGIAGDVFYCDLIGLDNTDCRNAIQFNVNRKRVVPDWEVVWKPSKCVNGLLLRNKTQIFDNGTDLGTVPDETVWTVDGKEYKTTDVMLTEADGLLHEGGKLKVSMRVGSKGCYETKGVEEIEYKGCNVVDDTVKVDLCYGQFYRGRYWTESKDTTVTPAGTVSSVTGCDSIYTEHIVVAEQMVDDRGTVRICKGDSYSLGDQSYTTSGEYTTTVQAEDGCRSEVRVNLVVKEVMPVVTDIEAPEDGGAYGSIRIEGVDMDCCIYTIDGVEGMPTDEIVPGRHVLVVTDTCGGLDCTSEEVEFEIVTECIAMDDVVSPGYVCVDDDSIAWDYHVTAGSLTEYDMTFTEAAETVGFRSETGVKPTGEGRVSVALPAGVVPGHYGVTFTFHDPYTVCDSLVYELDFEVRYPASLLVQKWNDVVALSKVETEKWGCDVRDVQWYADDEPIAGMRGTYLYLGMDAWLDTAVAYSAELARVEDGVRVRTCPLIPEYREVGGLPRLKELSAVPPVAPLYVDNVEVECVVMVYDVSGRLVSSCRVSEAAPEFPAPQTAGIYVVRVMSDEGSTTSKILVR